MRDPLDPREPGPHPFEEGDADALEQVARDAEHEAWREAMETEFVDEIVRIVGEGVDREDYTVAPDTSDELLEIRIQRLRELPSGIGHEELMRRVGPAEG